MFARRHLALLIAAFTAIAVIACTAATLPKPVEEMGKVWLGEMKFADTLHATTKGMKYWYERGIGKLIKVPYEKLFCANCHATCEDCHAKHEAGKLVDYDAKVARSKETCFKCHKNQKFAYDVGREKFEYADVHMIGMGVGCTYCHTGKEVHGIYKKVDYMYDNYGVFEVSCEKCHIEGYAPHPSLYIPEHRMHIRDIHCTACHSPTTVTCYSCHLSYAYETYVKKGEPELKYIPIVGWIFLAKDPRTGKLVPANIMVTVWNANGTEAVSVKIAKFFPHIVTPWARHCKDCHATPAAKELYTKGELKLVWYEDGKVKFVEGIIPIAEGTKLILQTFIWNATAKEMVPFKEVVVKIGPDVLIEDTEALTKEELEKMAKAPIEIGGG